MFFMPSPPSVHVGERYGRLTVLELATERDNRKNRHWRCKCDCGAIRVVRSNHLRSGDTVSCGCHAADASRIRTGDRARRHGHTIGKPSRTYNSWTNMIARCTRPNTPWFHLYGGRGITVCDRWRNFDAFLQDMGERPEGRTLDRIDPDGNYEPDNCRWATPSEQNLNRRRSA
jgi:hypothetical protein